MESKYSGKEITLVKGFNMELKDVEYAISDIVREPGSEVASGFYVFNEENLATAKMYAVRRAYKEKEFILEDENKPPTINLYKFSLEKAKDSIKDAYYNELNSESIHYIGDNLMNKFPPDCRYFGNTEGILPIHRCHICNKETCNRNAQYIEAILSDGVEYNLDDILKDVAIGNITDQEALDLINQELYKRNTPIKIQILLRQDALDKKYFEFVDSYTVKDEEARRIWNELSVQK